METNKFDSENTAGIIAAQPNTDKPVNPFPHVSAKRRAALEALQPTSQRKRRFDAQSLEEYAILAAKRFTDEEICSKMGWKVGTFKVWKSKSQNSSTLTNLVTRARQAKLQAHLDNIENASKGEGPHARADWRASAHIMQVMDANRFGTSRDAGNTTNQTAVIIGAGGEQAVLKMLDGIFAQRQSLPSPAAVKLIDCPANGQNDGQKQS